MTVPVPMLVAAPSFSVPAPTVAFQAVLLLVPPSVRAAVPDLVRVLVAAVMLPDRVTASSVCTVALPVRVSAFARVAAEVIWRVAPEASVTVPVPMLVAAPSFSVPAPTVAFQAVLLLVPPSVRAAVPDLVRVLVAAVMLPDRVTASSVCTVALPVRVSAFARVAAPVN